MKVVPDWRYLTRKQKSKSGREEGCTACAATEGLTHTYVHGTCACSTCMRTRAQCSAFSHCLTQTPTQPKQQVEYNRNAKTLEELGYTYNKQGKLVKLEDGICLFLPHLLNHSDLLSSFSLPLSSLFELSSHFSSARFSSLSPPPALLSQGKASPLLTRSTMIYWVIWLYNMCTKN